jgi:hypothetical protein
MKLIGSAAVALVVLYFADELFNDGRFTCPPAYLEHCRKYATQAPARQKAGKSQGKKEKVPCLALKSRKSHGSS